MTQALLSTSKIMKVIKSKVMQHAISFAKHLFHKNLFHKKLFNKNKPIKLFHNISQLFSRSLSRSSSKASSEGLQDVNMPFFEKPPEKPPEKPLSVNAQHTPAPNSMQEHSYVIKIEVNKERLEKMIRLREELGLDIQGPSQEPQQKQPQEQQIIEKKPEGTPQPPIEQQGQYKIKRTPPQKPPKEDPFISRLAHAQVNALYKNTNKVRMFVKRMYEHDAKEQKEIMMNSIQYFLPNCKNDLEYRRVKLLESKAIKDKTPEMIASEKRLQQEYNDTLKKYKYLIFEYNDAKRWYTFFSTWCKNYNSTFIRFIGTNFGSAKDYNYDDHNCDYDDDYNEFENDSRCNNRYKRNNNNYDDDDDGNYDYDEFEDDFEPPPIKPISYSIIARKFFRALEQSQQILDSISTKHSKSVYLIEHCNIIPDSQQIWETISKQILKQKGEKYLIKLINKHKHLLCTPQNFPQNPQQSPKQNPQQNPHCKADPKPNSKCCPNVPSGSHQNSTPGSHPGSPSNSASSSLSNSVNACKQNSKEPIPFEQVRPKNIYFIEEANNFMKHCQDFPINREFLTLLLASKAQEKMEEDIELDMPEPAPEPLSEEEIRVKEISAKEYHELSAEDRQYMHEIFVSLEKKHEQDFQADNFKIDEKYLSLVSY